MTAPVFRFAPSPNGLLHLGHAYSALLNQKMAQEREGRLLLRIEDTDTTRCKPQFVQAIIDDLAWLSITFEDDVRVQSAHFAEYDANLHMLWAMGAIYPCFCSRKEAQAGGLSTCDPDGQPQYGGTCRALPEAKARERMARGAQFGWRLHMAACDEKASQVWGDAMIAKRLVGSYYHIAVVTDDALQGVTHVVRGKDIEAATLIHNVLQRLLDVPVPRYHHHPLISDDAGLKLAKSRNSRSLAALRAEGVTAQEIRRSLGFA